MMQNAVDIMAMVQKTNAVKPKFDAPSKTFGNEKASFKKELFEARKEIRQDNKSNIKTADSYSNRTTENKAEKHAKVMANSNAKAEVKEKPAVDAKEHAEVKVQEDSQVKAQTLEDVEKPEKIAASEETVNSVLEMLQQLMQMLENLKQQGNANPNAEALKNELQEAIQKLEMTLTLPVMTQTEELAEQIKTLKMEFTEFAKQLEAADGKKLDSLQLENLIKDFTKKLTQAEAKLNQTLVDVNKPSGQAAITEQPIKAASNEPKDAIGKSTVTEVKSENNQQINVSTSEQPEASKDKKDNAEKEQSQSDASTKIEASNQKKQLSLGDKPVIESFNDVMGVQNEKQMPQLNVKQMITNLQKESLVKINSSDIINQVVKKADIIIQGSHQEMIMKLEPESLGKLNLKLVVENGLITAKFVAESQQVKEVLESSFNQLKDALQEKGIAVQNLSVSVGQQGAEFNSSQSFDQWKKSIKLNNKTTGDFMELDDELSINSNPYNYHDGKVDYRA